MTLGSGSRLLNCKGYGSGSMKGSGQYGFSVYVPVQRPEWATSHTQANTHLKNEAEMKIIRETRQQ